jgi:hypothetical protein
MTFDRIVQGKREPAHVQFRDDKPVRRVTVKQGQIAVLRDVAGVGRLKLALQ